MTNAEKIQAVINTLELLEIKPTYNNCNCLTGIYHTLFQVCDDLNKPSGGDNSGKNNVE